MLYLGSSFSSTTHSLVILKWLLNILYALKSREHASMGCLKTLTNRISLWLSCFVGCFRPGYVDKINYFLTMKSSWRSGPQGLFETVCGFLDFFKLFFLRAVLFLGIRQCHSNISSFESLENISFCVDSFLTECILSFQLVGFPWSLGSWKLMTIHSCRNFWEISHVLRDVADIGVQRAKHCPFCSSVHISIGF